MEHNAQNIIEKVLILARSDFPGGIAQSRRILSLARAVKKNGKEALVVLLNSLGKIKLQQKDNPTPKKGVEKGIEYIYAYNNINGSGNIIKKISSLIFGSYQAIKIVRHEARNKKIGLLSYEDNPAYIFLIAVWSRYKKIPLYMDLVEDNTIKRDITGYWFFRIMSFKTLKLFLRYFTDGVFVISEGLLNKFNYLKKFKKSVEILPILVDVDEFSPVLSERNENPQLYFVFGGNLEDNSGVIFLLDALAIVIKTFPDINLLVTGITSKQKMAYLKKYCTDKKVQNNVQFLGFLNESDYKQLLWNSLALIQSRDSSKFSQFGLPTKLGVYLSTGKPVIAARVGDLNKYLLDEKEILFFKPCNPDDIAEKMILLLKDKQLAEKIGKNGQKAAKQLFDESILGQKICKIMGKTNGYFN